MRRILPPPQSDRFRAMEPKSKKLAATSESRRTEAACRIGRGEDFLERSGRGRRRHTMLLGSIVHERLEWWFRIFRRRRRGVLIILLCYPSLTQQSVERINRFARLSLDTRAATVRS